MLGNHHMLILRVRRLLVYTLLCFCPATTFGQQKIDKLSNFSFENRVELAEKIESLLASGNLPAIQDFADNLIALREKDLNPTEEFERKNYLILLARRHPRVLRRHAVSFEKMITFGSEKQKLFGLSLISLVGYRSANIIGKLTKLSNTPGESAALRCQSLATALSLSRQTEYRDGLVSFAHSESALSRKVFCQTVRINQLVSLLDEIKSLTLDEDIEVRVAATSTLLDWDQTVSAHLETLITELSQLADKKKRTGVIPLPHWRSTKTTILALFLTKKDELSVDNLVHLLKLFSRETEMVPLQIYCQIFGYCWSSHANLIEEELLLVASQGQVAGEYASSIIEQMKSLKGQNSSTNPEE